MTPKVRFEVEGWQCSRCGHKWIPRTMTEVEPTICPKCKSPYWNRPRKVDIVASDKAARDTANSDRIRGRKTRP